MIALLNTRLREAAKKPEPGSVFNSVTVRAMENPPRPSRAECVMAWGAKGWFILRSSKRCKFTADIGAGGKDPGTGIVGCDCPDRSNVPVKPTFFGG